MASVLIADDSEAIRLVLKDILEIGKHDLVAEAIDGEDAIKKYSSFRPEIMLLDLAMPKKDGLTVVKEIIATYPDAKIIVVTAADNQKIINDCLIAGAKTFISKPFDFEKVLKVISNIASS